MYIFGLEDDSVLSIHAKLKDAKIRAKEERKTCPHGAKILIEEWEVEE